jgi:hypothetical protein
MSKRLRPRRISVLESLDGLGGEGPPDRIKMLVMGWAAEKKSEEVLIERNRLPPPRLGSQPSDCPILYLFGLFPLPIRVIRTVDDIGDDILLVPFDVSVDGSSRRGIIGFKSARRMSRGGFRSKMHLEVVVGVSPLHPL